MKLKAPVTWMLLAMAIHAQEPIERQRSAETASPTTTAVALSSILAGDEEYPTESQALQTVEIEQGFFSMASALPKLGHLKRAHDPYELRYGDLVHPLDVRDQEFHANVVVLAVAPGKLDTIAYVPIFGPTKVKTNRPHGLQGTLYIDRRGELTTTPPTDVYRRIEVGRVIDADTLLLHEGRTTILASPINKQCRANVWSRFEWRPDEALRSQPSAIASVNVNDGRPQIWRNNRNVNSSPSNAQLLDVLFNPENADELRFPGTSTGITINFSVASYVSDLWMQLARREYWTKRSKLQVVTYATATSRGEEIWSSVGPPRNTGLNTEVSVESVCQRIEIRWTASTGAHDRQGSLQHIDIFAKGRLDTLQISPSGPRIPYDRWDVVDRDKIILCSNRWSPGQHTAQIGVKINTNEVMMNYFFGWNRDWNKVSRFKPSNSLSTTVDTKFMDRRGYFDWVRNDSAKYDRTLHWMSLDVEFIPHQRNADNVITKRGNEDWTYLPNDSKAIQEERTERWQRAFANFRNITPNKLIGPFTHPNANNAHGIKGYINAKGEGVSHEYYRNALTRERIAKPLYEMSDYMTPHIFVRSSHTLNDWIALCEHYRDVCHRNGKFCIPHISARIYEGPRGSRVTDFAERLRIASEIFDGWTIFESRTDRPHSEKDRQIVAAAYRAEIERLQTEPVAVSTSTRNENTGSLGNQSTRTGIVGHRNTDKLPGDFKRLIGSKHYADIDLIVSAVLGGELDNPGEVLIGRNTYAKVYAGIVGPNNSTVNVRHGITGLTRVIQLYGSATAGTEHYPIPSGASAGSNNNLSVAILGSRLSIDTTSDWSRYQIHVVVKYRK